MTRSPPKASILLVALIILAGSGRTEAQTVQPFSLPGVAPSVAQATFPRAALLVPERLRQGDPLLVWALAERSLAGAEARLVGPRGQSLAAAAAFAGPALSPPPLVGAALAFRAYGFLMALPTNLPPGSYRVVVATGGTQLAEELPFQLAAALTITARDFPSEDIPLDAANSKLRTQTDARTLAEARKLYEILGRADADALYLDDSAFMLPIVPRRKSAGFGDRRHYLYQGGGSEASLHAGLDLAVATGTEVDACGPGRVVLAADRAVTGLTVVLEHLPGLYSIYMHLSAIIVAEGQVLRRGQVLGLSGSTGLSTGPHLHWELRAKGQAVDPEYWLSRPPLDKDRAAAIIARLIEGR